MATIGDSISGMTRGQCQVCGEKLDGRSYYCAEHKPKKSETADVITLSDLPEAKTVKVPQKGPRGDHYWSAFGTILVFIVNYLIFAPAGKLPEELQVTLQSELAVTEEELEPVMKPLLRIFSGTSASKKYGSKVLENSDVVPAIFGAIQIIQKMSQVQRILKEYNESINPDQQVNAAPAVQIYATQSGS